MLKMKKFNSVRHDTSQIQNQDSYLKETEGEDEFDTTTPIEIYDMRSSASLSTPLAVCKLTDDEKIKQFKKNKVTTALLDNNSLSSHPQTPIIKDSLNKPKLSTGINRNRPNSQLTPLIFNFVTADLKAIPVRLQDVLNHTELSLTPLLTDLINPAKVVMDTATKKVLNNSSQEGDILAFNAIRVSISDNKAIHALRIVDTQTSDYQKNSGAILAYWAPQGGYVDIPSHPQKGQPELVFTPGFSGCSLVADKLSDDLIRVRHVQGGKEDAEYNNLNESEHGQGMIGAMEYRHYGYHENEQGTLIENITGSAFMIYEGHSWKIKYQILINVPGILSLQESSVGWLDKQQQIKVKTRYTQGQMVIKVDSVSLDGVSA
ncbi:hypothetical protein NE897_11560 [Yersinia ruckeri]|uniref:hypothetical protein n=1 Tax=Yersinia ruckeri TaxID=29486 RepID=UPI001F46DAAD|nr:hypothetical protein [Yersinia ruckeri]EKN3362347.1 hypothetical protein [Yersinia ruckeri]EKN4202026.1 hypothetical protein [Yersinia ruckeri]EKN4208050.1 hypothetical protein [Yersinia ruckeri]EKN4698919.1 hypothetical protein [Yersinia ruckeri]EKN4706220.1 hypothetical protein [Yersinia ruckeri]